MKFAEWLSQSFGTGVLQADVAVLALAALAGVFLLALMSRAARGACISDLTGAEAAELSGRLDNIHTELRTLSQAFAFKTVELRSDIQVTCARARTARREQQRAA